MPKRKTRAGDTRDVSAPPGELPDRVLEQRRIIVGVTGGIAAYKAASLVRRLKKAGADVIVVMTRSATRFVQPLTFQTLSGHPVSTELFPKQRAADQALGEGLVHISLSEWAELVLVAPATANILGKVACGIADDLLSTLIMATTSPVAFAPAMNTNMLSNPVVSANLNKLRELGYTLVEPEYGELASGAVGQGRLASIERIVGAAKDAFAVSSGLSGKRVLVTAGRTEEELDPIRYLTNRSTGKMGYAVAQQAQKRGAQVWLVSGPSHLPVPRGVEACPVRSASDMHAKVLELFPRADVVIMAAAVADFRPKGKAAHKIKKSSKGLVLELETTPDIAADLASKKEEQMLVGFAVETEHEVENAQRKLRKKRWDLAVLNNPTVEGAGFGHDTNVVTLIEPDGSCTPLPKMSKHQVADAILDRVQQHLEGSPKERHG